MTGKSKINAGLSRSSHASLHEHGHRSLRRGRVSLPGQIYHISTATLSRYPFFKNFHAACAVATCFEDRDLSGDCKMLAWVLMPDHAHWLIQTGHINRLDIVVNCIKSASARKANRVLGRSGSLWQKAYHDHALRTDEEVVSIARYIVRNPVRAGLVRKIADYPFWNTIWL